MKQLVAVSLPASRVPATGYVAGGVVAAYRAALVGRDLWDYVRRSFARRSDYDERWLDTVSAREWVELTGYVALLDTIGDTLGTEELRSLVRRRLIDADGSNFFSTMLRSWTRACGGSPENMLHGAVTVWRAAHRNAGTMRMVSTGEGEAQLVIDGKIAAAYRSSLACVASLEGLALGLLDLATPRPVFLEVELSAASDPLSLVCRYNG